MKWVDIKTFDASAAAMKTLARVRLDDGASVVSFEGDLTVIADLQENGAEVLGRVLMPADGTRFLEALPAFLDNPNTLAATSVQEGPAAPPLA